MNITMPLSTVSTSQEQTVQYAPSRLLLENLLHTKLIRPRDWESIPEEVRDELRARPDSAAVLAELVDRELLTAYQAARLSHGDIDELILGNYRVLDFLGSGGMGVVLKAEHHLLRRPVAVKVLALAKNQDPKTLDRFVNEIWVLGQLQHPNIVTALDAGEIAPRDGQGTPQYYFVMEYVPGQNLEDLVKTHGPLDPALACDLMHQIAGALAEAHRHDLVHRDMKPSNVRVTPEGQAKLLDFGVTRIASRRITQPGVLLGSLAFLAPEQAQDSSEVDIRADIYGLGGTLYWCLTGRTPFPAQANPMAELTQRLKQPPPRVRVHRPDVAPELDELIATLMAVRPADRPTTPEAVQQALMPFLRSRGRAAGGQAASADVTPPDVTPRAGVHQVLIVDDESSNRNLSRIVLEAVGLRCDEAANGRLALDAFESAAYDLVILDIDMPLLSGSEVLRRLRSAPPAPHLKIIMVSGRSTSDEMAQMMLAGADDYLTKPFSATQLQARVKSALRLKDAQDRSDTLFRSLLSVNHDLEENLTLRDSDLVQARNALVLALSTLVAHRDTETGAHLMRLQRYSRCLAEQAAQSPCFATQIDANFIAMLECCAPVHDIGKAGVPDHILLKPGPLTPEERVIMQSHTTIGSDVLQKVAAEQGFAKAFLKMAIDITRSHHERFDGNGYPDRLAGDAIPLAARIVALGDVYDAMRSRRVYKPALPHDEVVRIMLNESPGHFDPALVHAFERCADRFRQLYRELVD